MKQSDIVKRIKSICDEFDSHMIEVGLAIARLELAKALAECEAAQQGERLHAALDEARVMIEEYEHFGMFGKNHTAVTWLEKYGKDINEHT